MKGKFFRNVLFFYLIVFISCENNRWQVNISSIEVDLNFQRFELALWQAAPEGISPKESEKLHEKFPKLYPLFCEGILKIGSVNSAQSLKMLNDFVHHKDLQELFETVESTYPKNSLNNEIKRLTNGFKRFKFHFPKYSIPEVKTMISAFNYSTVTADSLLVIGLDNYLGKDYKIYPTIGLPVYQFEKFERKYMVSDALKAWLTTEFEEKNNQNLIEQMIFNGKILYLLKALLPDEEPWIKFSYNQEELEWCRENENEVWFHFVDMELLYTDEVFKIRKYLGDAPFISGFPENSPGKVGQWMGYKIVQSYVDAHPQLSLADLMAAPNNNRFLQQSEYKPKRK